MPVALIAVALLSLPFLFVLARRPVLRRLAIRNAVRRPRESLLVVAGSLLGTAIMTGSFVVGDTFGSSIRARAHDQLGPVDEIVAAPGLDALDELRRRFDAFAHDDVDGLTTMVTANAAVATVSEPRRGEPRAQVIEVDFAEARNFGGDPAATGIRGETPAPGEAVVGEDLARELAVGTGDQIDVFAFGDSVRVRVRSVLPQRGVAGFWTGRAGSSMNVFVAPGTVAGLFTSDVVAAGGSTAVEPPRSLVLVSNAGGVEAGAGATADVVPALGERVDGMVANVVDVKRRVLEAADESGAELTRLYTSLGTFGVFAGILLLVNIFFMLADERKAELGMLRAMGLRRASLVGAFTTEGWCYALVSSFVGTFVGLGLGRLIMAGASRIFSGGPDEFRLTLRWSFEWSSVVDGMAVGFAIALVTIAITSVWLSRFNIIQAIRDLSEPARRRPRKRAFFAGLALAALGVLMTGVGIGSAAFAPLILGPVFVLVGIGPALTRNVPRTAATSALAAAVLGWGVVAIPAAVALGSDIDVFLFVIQGVVLVAAAVVLVAQHQATIGAVLGRLAARSLRVRLGLAYPLARRFRTSLTLGMFALVVFVLTYVSVISAMFDTQVDDFTADVSAGFNVVVESNPSTPVDLDALADDPRVRAIAPLVTRDADVLLPGDETPTRARFSAFDESLLQQGDVSLDEKGPYPSDEAAFRAVLADPSLALVDETFLQEGGGPPAGLLDIGDQLSVLDPDSGRERIFTVAARSEIDWIGNGAWVSAGAARDLFGESAVPNRAYVDVEDPEAFAAEFSARFLANGGEGDVIRELVDEALSIQQQFFLLMRGYLALGLVVGTAGIGVIMVRAVRERRRQVGVLRALGLEAAAVRSAFVIESAFIAVEGVVIGVGLALVTAFSITLTQTFGDSLPFVVPWLSIAALVTATLAFAVAATIGPARAAARIHPAVALRIAD